MKCVALINTYAAEDLKYAGMLIKNCADISIENIKKQAIKNKHNNLKPGQIIVLIF